MATRLKFFRLGSSLISFEFSLGNHGWATCVFQWPEGEITYSASYLTDPLGSLAEQARWLVDSAFRVSTPFPGPAIFSGEPGELHLELALETSLSQEEQVNPRTDISNAKVLVNLVAWEDGPDLLGGSSPDTVHCLIRCEAKAFARSVFDSLLDVYEKFGIVQYRERWILADFPMAHFAAIGRALGKPLPTRSLW